MKLSPLLALAGGLAMALGPSPAVASCGPAADFGEQLASADAVFVGAVMDLTNSDRTALVEVEEIWHGPVLPEMVTVHGGPDDPTTHTSVDRAYAAGGRYLFAVTLEDGALRDNGCSATREWAPELAAQRPEDVAHPVAPTEAPDQGESETAAPALWVVVGGVAAAAVAGISVVALRRRGA